jgi:TonB family protein
LGLQNSGTKKIIIWLGITIVLICVGYYYILSQPQYTIFLISKAYKNHDVASFYKYVDVDSIVDRWMDFFNTQMIENVAGNEWVLIGTGLAQLMMPNIRSQAKDYTKRSLEASIEEIAAKNKSNESVPAQLDAGAIQPSIKVITELSKVSLNVKKEGKIARLTIKTKIEQFKDFDGTVLKMRQTPQRYWKIIEIELPSFQKIIREQEITRKREECISNLKQIEGSLYVWSVDKDASTGAVPTKADLVPDYLKVWPKCGSKEYEVPRMGEAPVCPNSVADHIIPAHSSNEKENQSYSGSYDNPVDYSKLVPQKKFSDGYANYYEQLREKVGQKIKENYKYYSEEGSIVLNFTLKSDGSLLDVRIDKVFSSKSQVLQDIAIKSLKETSPFPPFPETLKVPESAFTLTLNFKKQ